MASLKMNGAI